MKQMTKDLAYYLSLPYTRRVRVERDDGGEYFVADVEELSGLESDGLTELEARYNLQLAFNDYITALLARNVQIAEPELWPGAARHSTVVRRVITSLFRFRRTPAEPASGVSSGSVWIDPPNEWSRVETDVETRGNTVGA